MVWVSLQQLVLHSGSVCTKKQCGAKSLNSGFLVKRSLSSRTISWATVVPRRDHLVRLRQYCISTKVQICLIYPHISEAYPDGLNKAGLNTSTSHKCVFVSFSDNSRICLVSIVFLVSCMCDRTGAI